MSILNQTNRFQQILFIALIIQIVLTAIILWPRPAASQPNQPLLAGVTADAVTQVVISDGDGKRIALAKQGDGWVLFEAGDYPANAETVTTLLNKMVAIKTNRLVTQTESSHKRLQVADDDFSRRVEITLADGNSHTLYVGSSGGVSATHVRADDQAEVYLTGDLESFDVNTNSSNWVETLFFTVPQTATTKLILENANGTFEFTRDGDTWSMEGLAADEVLDTDIVNGLSNQASSVRLTEPLGTEEQAAYGLAEPLATLTLETPEETYTLLVGAQDPEDKSYVFKASNSPYYVRISDFMGNSFVEKTRDNFIKEPPTPAPEATTEGTGDAAADETESPETE